MPLSVDWKPIAEEICRDLLRRGGTQEYFVDIHAREGMANVMSTLIRITSQSADPQGHFNGKTREYIGYIKSNEVAKRKLYLYSLRQSANRLGLTFPEDIT